MSSSLNIAIISDHLPQNTGSGGKIAIYGLGSLLSYLGHKVTYFIPPEFILDNSILKGNIRMFTKDALQSNNTDLVWLFNLRTWKYFRPFAKSFRFVLYCLEPLYRIHHLHLKFRDSYHQSRSYYFQRSVNMLKLEIIKLSEIASIRQASRQGTITTFAPNSQAIWQKFVNKKIELCSLPYPDFGLRKNKYGLINGAGLLLGNMRGIHTRYGIDFFFEKIWPKMDIASVRTILPPLRVVGGGNMPQAFVKPNTNEYINWVGYVPDIDNEWEQAKFLLVPVPIVDGVRTRVLEAWARGVPVIAHPAAEEGLPMMQPGVNYLSATHPGEWIEHLQKNEKNFNFDNLILAGRDAYEKNYSFDAVSQKYNEIINSALL